MKKVLTIAGSDSSGGAGIQADIKTITAHKMYAMSAVTALTAQNTTGVFGVLSAGADFVAAQIDACWDDIAPDAVKIGMLGDADVMKAVAQALRTRGAKRVVLDPVMVATSGGALMAENALETLKSELLPLATLLTPNIPEAQALCGAKISNLNDMREAARTIWESAWGNSNLKPRNATAGAVLVKGGHLCDNSNLNNESIDILFDGRKFFEFKAAAVATKNTHGTGCTLSSAIACALAAGLDTRSAVAHGKNFVTRTLAWSEQIGHGNGAIDHYFNIPSIF